MKKSCFLACLMIAIFFVCGCSNASDGNALDSKTDIFDSPKSVLANLPDAGNGFTKLGNSNARTVTVTPENQSSYLTKQSQLIILDIFINLLKNEVSNSSLVNSKKYGEVIQIGKLNFADLSEGTKQRARKLGLDVTSISDSNIGKLILNKIDENTVEILWNLVEARNHCSRVSGENCKFEAWVYIKATKNSFNSEDYEGMCYYKQHKHPTDISQDATYNNYDNYEYYKYVQIDESGNFDYWWQSQGSNGSTNQDKYEIRNGFVNELAVYFANGTLNGKTVLYMNGRNTVQLNHIMEKNDQYVYEYEDVATNKTVPEDAALKEKVDALMERLTNDANISMNTTTGSITSTIFTSIDLTSYGTIQTMLNNFASENPVPMN